MHDYITLISDHKYPDMDALFKPIDYLKNTSISKCICQRRSLKDLAKVFRIRI